VSSRKYGECKSDTLDNIGFDVKDKGEIRFYKSGDYVYAVGTKKTDRSGIYVWNSKQGKGFISKKVMSVKGLRKEFKIYAEEERVIIGIVSKEKNQDIFNFYYSPDAGKSFEHCTSRGPYTKIVDFNVLFEPEADREVVARIFILGKGGIGVIAARWW
jgi:hypothetical protein